MDLEFKSNSHKSRENQQELAIPERKFEKVTTGNVKTKKKGLLKLASAFISVPDDVDMSTYFYYDIIVPRIKSAVLETLETIFGDAGRFRKSVSGARSSHRSYDKEYARKRESNVLRARNDFNFEEIVYDTRSDAIEVLSKMEEILDEYKFVRVADLFEISGVTGKYTYNKYGWSDLRGARPSPVRDGYILILPPAEPID